MEKVLLFMCLLSLVFVLAIIIVPIILVIKVFKSIKHENELNDELKKAQIEYYKSHTDKGI